MREVITIYLDCWRKFGHFRGRARRREFAVWVAGLLLKGAASMVLLDSLAPMTAVTNWTLALLGNFWLITLINTLAIITRRLHDINGSAWWLLTGLVPIINFFLLIVPVVLDGQIGPNRFGDDPRTIDRNVCRYCRYDLTGNTTGLCPECGMRIGQRAMPED